MCRRLGFLHGSIGRRKGALPRHQNAGVAWKRFARRALAYVAVVNSTENFFYLSSPNVIIEKLERGAVPEGAVGSSQPLGRFFLIAESCRCLSADSRQPEYPIGFVGLQALLFFAPGDGSLRQMEYGGSLLATETQFDDDGLKGGIGESGFRGLPQLIQIRNAALQDLTASQRLHE
jgi:hypothetical protein